VFSIFNKPYPRNNDLKFRLKIVLLSGISVSVVLYFIFSFQDVSVFSSKLLLNVSLFGLVTIISTTITNLLIPAVFTKFFMEENWTVGKNLLIWLLMLLIIATGNMLLANYLYGSSISWKAFYTFLYYTIGIGFFVYAIISLIYYKLLVKKNEADAALMNAEIAPSHTKEKQENDDAQPAKENGLISITSENGKEEIRLTLQDLLYIQSADNYSKIILKKDNKLSVSIIRSSLKRIEEQSNHPEIYRCHRAYIVNLKKVVSVSGNSQGYRLHINDIDETLPVSRNSGKELLEKLKTLSHNQN
jgi:LytTr DNA-binding domain-containing protein